MGGDHWIWGIYFILLFISVVEIASASSTLAYKQITNDNPLVRHTTFLVAGFFCLVLPLQSLASAKTSYVVLLGGLAYVFGVALMLLMPVFGHSMKGATREIFGFQPVEFCKAGLVAVLCAGLTAKRETYTRLKYFQKNTELRIYGLMLLLMALAIGPIVPQNLSTALIMGITSVFILFLGKVKWAYLWRTLFVLGVLGVIGVSLLFLLHTVNSSNETAGGSHYTEIGFLDRANTWEQRLFDGSDVPLWRQDINDDNAQEMYAHMAIANSNGYGRFFGESQMRDLLPEAFSDYIYAIIFEETGVEGAVIVMLLYFILLWRCYRISIKTEDPRKRLLMIGFPLMMVVQALIHMGVCADAMFVTGQPLPLISRGGMSIVATSAEFGILFGLSHSILKEKEAGKQKESESEEEKGKEEQQ
jgi:cell division protein FtsW